MKLEDLEDFWLNYGIVLRLNTSQANKLKKFLKENNYHIKYDRLSLQKIYLVTPSGSKHSVSEGEDEE